MAGGGAGGRGGDSKQMKPRGAGEQRAASSEQTENRVLGRCADRTQMRSHSSAARWGVISSASAALERIKPPLDCARPADVARNSQGCGRRDEWAARVLYKYATSQSLRCRVDSLRPSRPSVSRRNHGRGHSRKGGQGAMAKCRGEQDISLACSAAVSALRGGDRMARIGRESLEGPRAVLEA